MTKPRGRTKRKPWVPKQKTVTAKYSGPTAIVPGYYVKTRYPRESILGLTTADFPGVISDVVAEKIAKASMHAYDSVVGQWLTVDVPDAVKDALGKGHDPTVVLDGSGIKVKYGGSLMYQEGKFGVVSGVDRMEAIK